MSMHALKTTTVLFKSECLVKTHNITLLDRNYIFKTIFSVNFSIYAYVISLKTNVILMQKDIKVVVTIS